jgi:glycosyltransferase involved in cell wall biosynthesis
MKTGIYNRHWNTLGGGEKYAGAIAQHLAAFGPLDLVGQEPFSLPALEQRLQLDLKGCRALVIPDGSDGAVEDLSAGYDLWINSSYSSTARSRARKSMLVVFFPCLNLNLLRLWTLLPVRQPSWLQKKLWQGEGFWNSYDAVIAISSYTQSWIARWWGAQSVILNPAVDPIVCPAGYRKKNIILSVGRFFVGGHNKKQDVMIRAFIEMYQSGLCRDWEYHLCGGTHPEENHQQYLRDLQAQTEGFPVFIHPDISWQQLQQLYCEAGIFWHATGYGQSKTRAPDQFEHFGITTVEAMSAGCIPVVIDMAGQREIVAHGENGYLWQTVNELKMYSTTLIQDLQAAERMRLETVRGAKQFSPEVFTGKLDAILRQHMMCP